MRARKSSQRGEADSSKLKVRSKGGKGEASYHIEKQDLGLGDVDLIRRLWRFARPYRLWFLLALVMLPLASAMSLIQPHLLQVAIDDHLAPGKGDGLELIAGLFLLTIVLQFFLAGAQYILMQWVGLRTLADMRMAVFRHLQSLRMQFFHRNPVGRLMTRLTSDIDGLQDAVAGGMVTVIADVLTLLAIVVILLVKDWKLALVTFVCVPFLFVLSFVIRRQMKRAFQVIRVKVARLNAYLQEAVGGMSVIQLFNRERLSRQEFDDINHDHRQAQHKQIRWDATLFALVEGIGSIAVALIIWYGSGGALEGTVTLGVLVAFVEYVRKFFVPIRDLSQKYALYQSAMASSERIFHLLEVDDRLPDADDPAKPSSFQQRIEFRDVWFAYDTKKTNDDETNWVLKGVSFTVTAGQSVALVGHTGAGKSTIIGLLTRMYDADKGQVLIDGVDIRHCDKTRLRRLFAVVLQDPFLFSGNLLENITLGDPAVDADAAQTAATAVHVSDFAERHPDGLKLPVAERGANLSTGEKQLVSFARALARDPDILVLDEATSNVDTETEAKIQDAVRVLLEGRTSVVIAHRLSTIRSVDKILVLHKGKLVESGSHDDLLEKGGLYAKLYRLQYQAAA